MTFLNTQRTNLKGHSLSLFFRVLFFNRKLYFFLCLFFFSLFLRLCVDILCLFLFFPLGIVFYF